MKMKKVLALVLVVALISVMSIASANITIQSKAPSGSSNSTVYSWYKIMSADIGTTLTGVNPENGQLSGTAASPVSYYVTDSTLAGLLDATTYLTATASADGTRWNITLDGTPTGAELAASLNTDDIKAAVAYADKGTASASGNSDVSITGHGDGYYLIVASNGKNLAVQTLGDVTIKEKNEYFTDTKTVDKTDMAVGETATYTITIALPSTINVGDIITVHDILDDRLTYNGNVTATFNNGAVTLTDATGSDAYATAPAGSTVIFEKKFTVADGMPGNNVVLTYTATVNATAINVDTGFINTSFAHDSNFETLPSRVQVYTFDFDLNKTFNGATGSGTYTATFKLEKGSTRYKFDASGTTYTYNPSGTVDVLSVDNNQTIKVKGLDADTYTLTELTTATGYNLLTDPITVTITDTTTGDKNDPATTPSHTVTYSFGSTSGTGRIDVENNAGTQLPSTGGIGTTIFYVAGLIMVLGAATILIARRRADAE